MFGPLLRHLGPPGLGNRGRAEVVRSLTSSWGRGQEVFPACWFSLRGESCFTEAFLVWSIAALSDITKGCGSIQVRTQVWGTDCCKKVPLPLVCDITKGFWLSELCDVDIVVVVIIVFLFVFSFLWNRLEQTGMNWYSDFYWWKSSLAGTQLSGFCSMKAF